ncbi:MAG TPA: nuclear transport factor 2 family protein [Pyrinomonadaceae bacterium]|nr:nuclear transport factor 2 family protein [Pyrinomonadaceae bacterium]
MPKMLLIVVLSFVFSFSVAAQSDPERDAIKRTALNYAEGWYEGNADKMESALHPDLAKRIVRTNDKGQSGLGQMSAMSLVQGTRGGSGKQTPAAEQQKDVVILDMIGGAATVKLEMRDWVDYMHIGKFSGKWVIINVLWELKPKKVEEKKN